MRIVSEIVEKGDLGSEVQRFSHKLVRYSSTTLQETKKMLNKELCGPLPLLRLCKVIWSKEMEERISQVLGKRAGGRNESGK